MKRRRMEQEKEEFIKQFEAGGAMRPYVVVENPAAVGSPSVPASEAETEMEQVVVQPDVMIVDAQGSSGREPVIMRVAPLQPVVDTTQAPRRKKVKRDMALDSQAPKRLINIAPKPVQNESSETAAFTLPTRIQNMHTVSMESTESLGIDVDALLRDIDAMDAATFASLLTPKDFPQDGGFTSVAALPVGDTGCLVSPQLTPDVAPPSGQVETAHAELAVSGEQDFLEEDWMRDIGERLIGGLMEFAPDQSFNADATADTNSRTESGPPAPEKFNEQSPDFEGLFVMVGTTATGHLENPGTEGSQSDGNPNRGEMSVETPDEMPEATVEEADFELDPELDEELFG